MIYLLIGCFYRLNLDKFNKLIVRLFDRIIIMYVGLELMIRLRLLLLLLYLS